MPLAPFVGVNHHRQSIFFGMALLRSEGTSNFSWLFETWLKAMYDKHPLAIITDQDKAMKSAIKIVFPNTIHRCCKWHIMRKARENLATLYRLNPTFQPELELIINCSKTILEFENNWAAMIEKYKLKENNHLKNMYEMRTEWVPAYFQGIFFADMSTTQRNESVNALFKMWVNAHTSIYKFVLKFDAMIETIWQNEDDEDLKTMDKVPNLWSMYEFEKDARAFYTRNVFKKFKELLYKSTPGGVIEKETHVLYEVNLKGGNCNCKESYVVSVDKKDGIFSCDCKGFDFEGLLCSHALKVMCNLGIEHLPSHYILKRWCKNANAEVKRPINDRSRDAGNSEALRMFRIATLKPKLNQITELASNDVSTFKMVDDKLSELLSQVLQMVPKNSSQLLELQTANDEGSEQLSSVSFTIHDPPPSQCKGRKRKPARWKSPIEIPPKKGNTCSYCKKKGLHNIRTCPEFLAAQKGYGKKHEEFEQNSVAAADEEEDIADFVQVEGEDIERDNNVGEDSG
ncbi:Protein FAR1-RELATED SEQUENCE 5 [Rhynchospora pubera]|uniref:Protein FAR1-RELATED SEQUENCE n=1 Tax=Rhynchospora pubera TaxID=906938 RepID=A0AAV8GYS3_9POAL|nr:Protein FAR1-RELATED SEQUENCE 5 [Rhynchospora pubera]